jgi:hypothetical protein
MKKCSSCFEYTEIYADEVGELCEHCADELDQEEWEQGEVVE